MSQPTETPRQSYDNLARGVERIGSLSEQGWQNLATLASQQQADFDRLIRNVQKVPLKDKLNKKVQNATGRVQAVYTQQARRLSESALVTKGRDFGQGALDTGAELARGAADIYETGRAMAQTVGREAKEFGRAAKEEAQLFNRDMKAMGNDLREGVKAIPGDLKAAGKSVADKASRWFKTQKTRVTIASEGARATFAAMKFDATMPQATTPKDLTQLSQIHSQAQAPGPENVRMQAAQAIATRAQAQLAAHAAGGIAPASAAVGGKGQTTAQAQQPTEQHGQQKNPDKGIGGR
jgi:hypothetical protein